MTYWTEYESTYDWTKDARLKVTDSIPVRTLEDYNAQVSDLILTVCQLLDDQTPENEHLLAIMQRATSRTKTKHQDFRQLLEDKQFPARGDSPTPLRDLLEYQQFPARGDSPTSTS